MILITGGKGQLGSCLSQYLTKLSYKVEAPSHAELDITDRDSVNRFFGQHRPSAVVHCAAFSNVDRAEQERELCQKTNAEGTAIIAEACKKANAYLLYISTDYVFDGEKNGFYEAEDPVHPISVYGVSKAEGERLVMRANANNAILRTSWLFGDSQANFVQAILRRATEQPVLRVVSDQIGSPTYTEDLAVLIEQLLRERKSGIFHGTNEGTCSWAQFAQQILADSGLDNEVEWIRSEDYPSPVKRPANSRLSKRSLDQAGLARLPSWQDGLKRYLNQI